MVANATSSQDATATNKTKSHDAFNPLKMQAMMRL